MTTPTIEAKIQEYRELGGNPAHEMWLRTALTTIDQNEREEERESVSELWDKIDTLVGFLNVPIDTQMEAGIKAEWEDYKREALSNPTTK